ncbi:O-antigen ligase family protein [Sphingomonas sp.]|uniref:O-antigen ligase family protein n=1 Tax=Sphingomonas sp. TaxID=28214 RepID=UPI00286E09C7|nr:O-antigen ligase family protein [Sphingomonas sp.]
MTINRDLKAIGILLALSLALGGSGLSFPRLNLCLQIAALAVAAYLISTPREWRFPRLTWVALGLVGAILALPLLQLIPLPPPIWTSLSGRAVPADLDALLGAAQWRPLSLDVERTVRSFVTLLPAAVVFTGSLFLRRSDRAQLLWVVVAVALASALLGIVQVATGGWLTPYPSGHTGHATGLFVNRNHNAALLLVAMPVAAALAASQIVRGMPQAPWIAASAAAVVVLVTGVLGTTSRMGFVLLPLALAASLALLFYGRARWTLVTAAAGGIAALAIPLVASDRFDRVVARFAGFDDPRLDYWTDIQWALDYYGLAGTGFGTFIPVYKSAESLDAVVPKLTNHAHNDYLEIMLDGGVPAILLLVAVLGLLAIAAYGALRAQARPAQKPVTIAAATGLVILLAASVVDYPVRMPALSALFALCGALLMPSRGAGSPAAAAAANRPRLATVGRYGWVAGLAIVGALLVVVVQAGMSSHALRAGQSQAALRWAGWSTEAHERLATRALLRNQPGDALAHGYAAARLSPISASAIRSIGLARLSQGAAGSGNGVMQLAVVLGWRDPYTQLWAIDAARRSAEPAKALQRAEALFRQQALVAPATSLLLDTPPGTQFVPLLAQQLARRPDWRATVFAASAELPPAQFDNWLRLVALLGRSRAPVTIDEGQPLLAALLAQGNTEQAQRLWALLHPGGNLIANGGFDAADPRRGPGFPAYWHVPARNRSAVTVDEGGSGPGGRALHVRSPTHPLVVQQTLLLRPGSYEFTYRARAPGGASPVLQWELQCVGSGLRQSRPATVAATGNWQQISAIFTVPIRDCPIQRLAFTASGAMPVDNVWIDSIRLASTGG